ncbi:MAG TPA: hypothetical protein VGO93_02020 [Candidatus Xenobia bacterium]|jgi:protein tyrosine/serine phosphatase
MLKAVSALLLLCGWVAWAQPVGVPNFGQVSPAIYRGAQPTRAGFEALQHMGVKTIVDLRAEESDIHRIAGMNFRYFHLDEIPGVWQPHDVAAFLKIVADPDNAPIFVHCDYGSDRTGEMIAAYRIVHDNWRPEQAIEEALTYHFRPIFGRSMDQLRRLDPAAIRQEVAAMPAPLPHRF